MRKQTTGNFTAINATQNQLKERIKVKKNSRYIYTEEDLGEGLLEAGIAAYDPTEQQDNLNTKPWATMLRVKW